VGDDRLMRFQPLIGDISTRRSTPLADPVIKAHFAAVGATAFPGSPGELRPAAPLTHIAGRAYLGNTNW
jgi:hypothetical protein